jgi:hypothetical protein
MIDILTAILVITIPSTILLAFTCLGLWALDWIQRRRQ